MKTPLRLALVGDYHPDIVAHQAIPLAIDDAAYGRESIEEGYHCRYGVSSAFAAELEQGDLRVTGWDEEGEIRAVELVTHPFFVATLFQHERHALDGRPAPLVQAFLRAAAQ
ncbi:hypothetical protein AAHV74_14945 [Klebsiella pneumoniae]|nr:hypothetical protein [Klebsiella pneumoniae]